MELRLTRMLFLEQNHATAGASGAMAAVDINNSSSHSSGSSGGSSAAGGGRARSEPGGGHAASGYLVRLLNSLTSFPKKSPKLSSYFFTFSLVSLSLTKCPTRFTGFLYSS